MKILSLDPASTKNCGWALLENKQVLEVGKYTLGKPNYEILDEMYSQTRSLLQKYEPDVLVMEDSIGFGHAPTRKKIAENTGVIKLACLYLHTKYIDINTNTAAKTMIGSIKRGQKKKKTIEYIEQMFQIKTDEHIADAILMGLYYAKIHNDK